MCLHIVAADFGLRDSLCQLLSRHGFAVVEYDGASAFRARGSPADEDRIILDLDLPGCEGVCLLQWLCLERPGLPVIVLYGTMPPAAKAVILAAPASLLLRKPFVAADLLPLLAGADEPSPPYFS